MTHLTDDELDALVGSLHRAANNLRHEGFLVDATSCDVGGSVLTAFRTQIAELQAERDQLQLLANGQEQQLEIQGNMLIKLNSRCIEQSDRAEAALAALEWKTTVSPEVQALVYSAEKLLEAYSAIFGVGNPWGDELRAALAALKEVK